MVHSFKYKTTFLVLLCLVSIAGNVGLFYFWYKAQSNTTVLSTLQMKYPLLSRRAVNPNYQNDLIVNFLPLREKIHQEVDSYSDSIAIYFEYLPTGTTIGVNEDKEFTAESLLKVPVVMAYYHKRERLGMKDDPIVEIQKNELNKDFGDLYKKGVGYKIALSKAVSLALTKSDNTASLILANQITNDDFNFVYEGLDIPETLDKNLPLITAQEYSSILKALYFGSVLTNDDSEEILSLLTRTEFNNLLPSGVGENIPVAHKIGLVNREIYQDCGIVYLMQRPYILCMVSKSDYLTAQTRMQRISKMVYEYVSQVKVDMTY